MARAYPAIESSPCNGDSWTTAPYGSASNSLERIRNDSVCPSTTWPAPLSSVATYFRHQRDRVLREDVQTGPGVGAAAESKNGRLPTCVASRTTSVAADSDRSPSKSVASIAAILSTKLYAIFSGGCK